MVASRGCEKHFSRAAAARKLTRFLSAKTVPDGGHYFQTNDFVSSFGLPLYSIWVSVRNIITPTAISSISSPIVGTTIGY